MSRHEPLASPVSRRSLIKGAAGVGLSAPAIAAGLAAPGKGAAQEPTPGGTLRLTLAASANVNLNPIGVTTIGAFHLMSVMYDGLVCSSATWEEVEPALAETWEVSEDGLTYTFHLRQGVTWHDGQPFTAADVEFTYTTILTQAIGSYMAGNLTVIKGAQAYLDETAETVEGIVVVDDATIQFVLDAPNAPFVFAVLTQHSIIPRHVWEEVAPEEMAKPGTWEQGQIGTGPFKFVTYEADRFLEFERYDDAWRGAPLLDKVQFIHVGTTPEAMAAALEAGDIDYTSVSATEFERLSANPELVMSTKPIFNIRAFGVNVGKPYLQDVRVRQAIVHGIDRVGICETILANMSTPTNSLSPSAKWANTNLPAYEYDPELATSLLAEAGWDASQEIELSLYYQDQPHKDSIAFVQQQLGEIGITANVVQLDGSAVQSYYYEDKTFDLMLLGYGVSPDFDEFRDIFACDATWPAGQNAMGYCNPQVDELFVQGRATTDDVERKQIYDEAQVILADELPWIPFYNLSLVGGFNARVQDGDAIFNAWNRPYNWSIEKVWIAE
ncbi:MAG: ABC transporter substrate-binding protein [Thermomicrobiales bacterium]